MYTELRFGVNQIKLEFQAEEREKKLRNGPYKDVLVSNEVVT